MRIESLYNKLGGNPAFIVGTGPSMRFFPLELFSGSYAIGLNQAWKYTRGDFKFELMLTVHPELYQEYETYRKEYSKGIEVGGWAIKKKPPMETLMLDDPNFYVFNTSPDLSTVKTRPADTLYIGEGIQCTAIDLLARMGANPIILIGVDMNSIEGDFHGHDQHVRWLGQTPEVQYALYRKKTAQVRSLVRDEFNVHVLSMTPFLGTDAAREDYVRLKSDFNMEQLPTPKDVSPYTRK